MSRGPGKWQRLILERLKVDDWVFLVDILPDNFTGSDKSALYRAALNLWKTGIVDRVYGKRYKPRSLQRGIVVGNLGQVPAWAWFVENTLIDMHEFRRYPFSCGTSADPPDDNT